MKGSPIMFRHVAVAAGLMLAVLGHGAAALAAGEDPDWPCQQRKVPQISAGQIWTGPSLDTVGDTWRDDPAVSELAHTIAARRTELADAKERIERFAGGAGAAKDQELTALAAGVLSIINGERASIMAGIERYTKRQRELAAKVERQAAELDALPQDGTPEQNARRDELTEMQTWDTRILQERERSLTYVCELPVMLEQRAFALGRAIQSHLE
jgi:hypothetical protein